MSLNNSMTPRQNKMTYQEILSNLRLLSSDAITNDERITETRKALEATKNLTNSATTMGVGEQNLDSHVMRTAGELTVQYVHQMVINSNVYDWRELAERVSYKPDFWDFALPQQVRSTGFLLGAFDPVAQPVRARAPRRPRQEQQRAAAVKRAQHVDRMEEDKEDTSMVKSIRRLIEQRSRGGPLSYFHCVIDPDSFSRTVENIYYMSYLARDGKISVDIDEVHGIPMVRLVGKESGRAAAESKQFVISIDMPRWKKLIQAFDIKEAMINVRQNGANQATTS